MEPLISAKDLKKNFGKVEALKGVSLDVAEGEKVVVIGPSGSGKSVLIRSINGLERPDSGELTVNGIDKMCIRDSAIASQDIARVSHIPGVGKKTAERIILELKGTLEAVSYTHLDVYKRQPPDRGAGRRP